MTDLLKFWFTFERSVSREQYLRHGLGLMALKYSVDAALIWTATNTFWSPLDYLQTVPLESGRWAGAPSYLAPLLALWTLPFLWIGVSMTIRRLLDASCSAWWSLLFFIPVISYVLFAVLVIAPGKPLGPFQRSAVANGERLPSALLSMAVGSVVGLLILWLCVIGIGIYGFSLFMGAPFIIGLVTAYTLQRRFPASLTETVEVVAMTLFLVAGAAFLVGFEGGVCLMMIAPLALVIAIMGGIVGRYLAKVGEGPARGTVLIAILMPGSALLEKGEPSARIREVVSSVVISAPPNRVWDEVVSFSPIPEPTSLLFRLGLAYPTHAEIRGSGVGAIRYCHFSTGAFVEPITAWEPGRRLAFDVAESPRPLKELSIWNVTPPHLEGYLVSKAGEFRLVPLPDGSTRLEGSTWYEQRLKPEGYWVVFSDYIIGRIHRRVLDHIKAEAESAR